MSDYEKAVAKGFEILTEAWSTWYMDPRATDLKWDEIIGFVGDPDYIVRKFVTMKNSADEKSRYADVSVQIAHGWAVPRPFDDDRAQQEQALTDEWRKQIEYARKWRRLQGQQGDAS